MRILAALAASLTLAACASPPPPAPATVPVPELVGVTMDAVYDQLQAAGLSGRLQYGSWNDGYVAVSTDPKAGKPVPRGGQVTVAALARDEVVFYSKPMPDLTGVEWLNFAESPAGPAYPMFTQVTWRQPTIGETPGTVVGQSPEPGATLGLGQAILLTVAAYQTGPDPDGSWGDWSIDIDAPNVCRRTKWC